MTPFVVNISQEPIKHTATFSLFDDGGSLINNSIRI